MHLVIPLLSAIAKHNASCITPSRLDKQLAHLVSKAALRTLQVTMHVCVFVFDLLYVDGDSLVHLPLRQRRNRLAAALPNLQLGHVQLATSLEFQPAAVSMAVAASKERPSLTASASNNGLLASPTKEGFAATASKGGATTPSQEGSAAFGAQASQLAQQPGKQDAAVSNGNDAHCGDNAKDDAVMPNVLSNSGQRHKVESNQHALGSGDTDATAAAQDALPQAAAASGPTEDAAAAAGSEALVSDLAVQSIEDRIQEFLLESFAGGTEGLMLKALDVAAGYQPSKRSDSWIKLKRQAPTSSVSKLCLHWTSGFRLFTQFVVLACFAYSPCASLEQAIRRGEHCSLHCPMTNEAPSLQAVTLPTEPATLFCKGSMICSCSMFHTNMSNFSQSHVRSPPSSLNCMPHSQERCPSWVVFHA